jgi:hypothetical protein
MLSAVGGSRYSNRGILAALRTALLLGAAAAVALAAAAAPAPAAGRRPVAPADRAATHAYLVAELAYTEAEVSSAPAAVGAVTQLAGRIGGECSGALAGSPVSVFGEEGRGRGFPTPRQIGERNRQQNQLLTLESELGAVALAPLYELRDAAQETFLATARALRWTSSALTRGVQEYLSLVVGPRPPLPPAVCADMRAWAASGYRTLSAGTKAYALALQSQLASLGAENVRNLLDPTSALRPYEGPAELALARRVAKLRASLRALERPVRTLDVQLERTVGIHEPLLERDRAAGKPVVVGRGRTAAGESFVARLERRPADAVCRFQITIESNSASGASLSSGSCVQRFPRRSEPSVQCNAGRLTIESATLPATRRVRLLLSDGRTVTSAAIVVPRRLGGPAGVYYQVVRGPSPIPVSLTELDAQGRALRTAKLPAVVECTEHPVKYVRGGLRTLVHGQLPGGGSFSIVAERYRFLGSFYSDLKLEQPPVEGGGLLSSVSGEALQTGPPTVLRRRLFSAEESTGCTPRPYVIVYGIVKRPGDTVLARTPSGLVPLSEVPVPPQLKAGGSLAYGVFSPPPSQLVVRAPDGRTIASERLEGAQALVERCEGEAEG